MIEEVYDYLYDYGFSSKDLDDILDASFISSVALLHHISANAKKRSVYSGCFLLCLSACVTFSPLYIPAPSSSIFENGIIGTDIRKFLSIT